MGAEPAGSCRPLSSFGPLGQVDKCPQPYRPEECKNQGVPDPHQIGTAKKCHDATATDIWFPHEGPRNGWFSSHTARPGGVHGVCTGQWVSKSSCGQWCYD